MTIKECDTVRLKDGRIGSVFVVFPKEQLAMIELSKSDHEKYEDGLFDDTVYVPFSDIVAIVKAKDFPITCARSA